MGISLSGGPWQYNRFNLAEASKPDYLDFDKDGDKKEPMKKALKEKGKKKDDCECKEDYSGEYVTEISDKLAGRAIRARQRRFDRSASMSGPNSTDGVGMFGGIKKGMGFGRQNEKRKNLNKTIASRNARTGSNLPKVEGFEPIDKKELKEWVSELIDQGYDLSEYTWDDMIEMFNEGSDIRYPKKDEINSFTKRKDDPKVAAGRKAAKEMGLKMNEATIEDAIIDYLMTEGFANNPVSAEIMFNHMSEEWLEAIEEAFKPFPKEKVRRQADNAYKKEQDAARANDEPEVNKQMQRRIAMNSPWTRRTALQNKKN